MKLCRRAVEFVQVMNEDGLVRLCSWQKDGGIIGKLTEQSLEEIYHGEEAKMIREKHVKKDYSNCDPNACPYVANDNVEEMFIELDEFPRFPKAIYLAYENVCNYHCVMCTVPDCAKRINTAQREEKYNKIDAELRKVLPYVKKIGANGLGELFTSKHTLKLLSEWEPIAEPSECSVNLETNGSLFNEKNWAQISNLGKYNLKVSVTVLSFEEDVYQELSGTELPISNLIDNLHFIKSLREKGIINYLEIATVYQYKNFRQLPEFAKRCLEEFSADYVRLRPFEPWREVNMQEWMRDVRNEYHPNHKEFLDVFKDPIFKHPKVHDWGGGKVSGLGPETYGHLRAQYHLMEKFLCDDNFRIVLDNIITTSDVVIYGMGIVGKALVSVLKSHYDIPYCIDRAMNEMTYENIPIYDLEHLSDLSKEVTVLLSAVQNEDFISNVLEKNGYTKIVAINKLENK